MSQKEIEKESPDLPAPKRSPVMMIVMVVNLLLVGGVLAFLFLGKDAPKTIAEQPEDAPAQESGTLGSGPVLPMETFIVNLADDNVNRYLKMGLSLELANAEAIEKVKKHDPQIRDSIIILTSDLTFQEIRSAKGKKTLRDRISSRLDELIGMNQVKSVYFTEFVVQ